MGFPQQSDKLFILLCFFFTQLIRETKSGITQTIGEENYIQREREREREEKEKEEEGKVRREQNEGCLILRRSF